MAPLHSVLPSPVQRSAPPLGASSTPASEAREFVDNDGVQWTVREIIR